MFFLSVIPLIIIGGLSYTTYMKALKAKLIDSINTSLEQTGRSVDWKVKGVHKYMDLVLSSERIITILNEETFDPAKGMSYKTEKELEKFFYSCFYGDSTIKYAALFNCNGGCFLYNGGVLQNEEEVKKSGWYRKIVDGNGRIVWTGQVVETNLLSVSKDYFIAGRVLKDVTAKNLNQLGVFMISLDNDFFSDSFADVEEIPGAEAAIVDRDGMIITQQGMPDMNDITGYPFYHQIRNGEKGYLFTKFKGQQVAVVFSTSIVTGWKIVKIVPSKYLIGELQNMSYLTLFLLLGSFVFCYIVSYAVSRGISRPIKTLAAAMKQVGQKNFDIVVKVISKDEIGMISEGFNTMIKNIKDLFTRAIEEEQMKRKAQIRALQYQINPHFLYNTLSSIRLISCEAGDLKAAEMMKTLINLLKNTISKAEFLITIGEEIGNIEDYIQIQKIQYENRLMVQYAIDEEILKYQMPSMLLQPLVENAIIHGLNNKLNMDAEEALIEIRGYIKDRDIIFEICDNGVGIDSKKIAGLLQAENPSVSEKKSSVHIGIKNIHERLQYEFGKSYGVTVESEDAKFTLVRLNLPCIEKKEEIVC
jgi:two-component system sensor histidine kinase YesM